MEDYDEAVRLDPNNPEVYVYRGIECEKDLGEHVVGNYSRALADFDRATELDPAYANAYFQRGRIWTGRREFGKAMREFEMLVKRNPNHPLGHQALAWALSSCEDALIRDGQRAVREATIAAVNPLERQAASTRSPPPVPRSATSRLQSNGRTARSEFFGNPKSQTMSLQTVFRKYADPFISAIEPCRE